MEVVYARPKVQALVTVELGEGATARDAIQRSGLLERFPEIDLARNKVGVFGTLCALDRRLYPGDRVEIYRPLRTDPQALRRRRAAHRAGR